MCDCLYEVQLLWNKHSVIQLFIVYQVNAIVVDDLVPSITRSSADIVLTTKVKYVQAFILLTIQGVSSLMTTEW